MESSNQPDNELRAALETFETSLITPAVPGEVDQWAKTVLESWIDCVARVRLQTSYLHRSQYQRMKKEDPEMQPRIEQLQMEDQQIESDLTVLSRCISRIAVRTPRVEPNELALEKDRAELVRQGVALVARVRQQEAAVRTWFVESFNRDRGVAD